MVCSFARTTIAVMYDASAAPNSSVPARSGSVHTDHAAVAGDALEAREDHERDDELDGGRHHGGQEVAAVERSEGGAVDGRLANERVRKADGHVPQPGVTGDGDGDGREEQELDHVR